MSPSRSRGHGDQQQGELGGRRRARPRPCPHQAAQLTRAKRSAPPAASLAAVYKCLKLRAGPKFPPRQQLLSEFYSRVLVTERWSPPGLVLEGGSACVGWGCRGSQDHSPQGAPSPVPTAPGLALPPRSPGRHPAPAEAAASGAFVKLLFTATVTPASLFHSPRGRGPPALGPLCPPSSFSGRQGWERGAGVPATQRGDAGAQDPASLTHASA